MISKISAKIREHAVQILLVLCVIVIVVLSVVHSNAVQSHVLKRLGSSDRTTRDTEVAELVRNGGLADALVETEDPNTDATSPKNVASLQIRLHAAHSVTRLLSERKISDKDAFTTLLSLYKDADSGVKSVATDGLSTLAGAKPGYLTAIVAKLKDGDPDVRSAAVDTLGKVGGTTAAGLVYGQIDNAAARDAAEAALVKIGKPSVPFIAQRLGDNDLPFREKLVSMLGDIGDASGLKFAIQQTDPSVPAVRRVALVSICKIVQSTITAAAALNAQAPSAVTVPTGHINPAVAAAVPILVSALNNVNDDGDARAQAAVTLGNVGGGQVIPALALALSDYDSSIRNAAMNGIESAGAPAVVSLQHLLMSKGLSVPSQESAIEALAVIGGPQSLATVKSFVKGSDTAPYVKRAAVIGLGLSAAVPAIPLLVSELGDKDGLVASSASQSLLNPALESSAIKPLIAALASPGNVSFNASTTLSKMGDLAVPALLADLVHAPPTALAWAIVTLGRTNSKDSKVSATLARLCHSNEPNVQYAAQEAALRLQSS